VVSMLASGIQDRGFKPGQKFLSMPSFGALRHVKEPYNYRGSRNCRLNLIGHFSPIVPPLANRGLSGRLMWSASGDEMKGCKLKRG
jgi:hypothetical protein